MVEVDPDATIKLGDDHYVVLIGHRRMAAAKLAGLTELPCVIVDMTEREQVQTMLVENMQRSDLTVYEEAKGFQMMLDLGDTVETVAEKPAFPRAPSGAASNWPISTKPSSKRPVSAVPLCLSSRRSERLKISKSGTSSWARWGRTTSRVP